MALAVWLAGGIGLAGAAPQDGAESLAAHAAPPAAPVSQEEVQERIARHAYRHGVRVAPGLLPATTEDRDGPYLRYAKAVGYGQIEPGAAGVPWLIARDSFDPSTARAALARHGLTEALELAPPRHPAYWRLVAALARYRELAANGGWPFIPGGPVLALGSTGDRVTALRRRLAAEDGLAAATQTHSFDRDLERAVLRFQARHGLAADGRVGRKTLAALNVPVGARIAQIIANLERWRWTPRTLRSPRIEINVAAAELAVLDTARPALRMRVIVGAPRHPTPLLQSHVQAVILNPPWNIPASIVRREILPLLRTDPRYLAENDIRILGRAEDPYGQAIDWRRRGDIPGTLRLQQQPGPLNALGRIKFDIPNRFDIYLHDTPAPAAFKRPERALSHGCIRLQEPETLLAYVLRSRDEGARRVIEDAFASGRTARLPVPEPLPVYIFYWTAFAAPDGEVAFRDDIYGHDDRMNALLNGAPGEAGLVLLAGGCGENG